MNTFSRDMERFIGNTPLVRLRCIEAEYGLSARLFAKAEMANPTGSTKIRVAKAMLDAAERSGALRAGGTVIEPTSGNTGIGLAAIGVPRGYRVILTMPNGMSAERRALLRAYGAELVLTPQEAGMAGAIERARQLAGEISDSYIPGQFDNPANPAAHEAATGPEIWRDSGGRVDVFVAGVGTGGTITGVGRYLRAQNPGVRVAAVEPAGSPVLSGGAAGPHPLQGIGAGFVPGVLDVSVYGEVARVTGEQADAACRLLARREGILAGISSGAALAAAAEIAARPENAQKNVVVLLPDSGERYLR